MNHLEGAWDSTFTGDCCLHVVHPEKFAQDGEESGHHFIRSSHMQMWLIWKRRVMECLAVPFIWRGIDLRHCCGWKLKKSRWRLWVGRSFRLRKLLLLESCAMSLAPCLHAATLQSAARQSLCDLVLTVSCISEYSLSID